MTVVNFTELRSNLAATFDAVVNNCDTVTVHRRGSENVVVMSESEFNGWKETIYLMSNPHNAERLMASITEAERGEAKERDVDLDA